MKALKEIFGKKEIKKSINTFLNQLDLNVMMKVKGGDSDHDEDLWPDGTSSTK